MLKDSLRKLRSEFGFLAEEASEAGQNIMNRLDRSVKLDEVDTIAFGLETDDGKIVKVYVKVDQAEDFEKALSAKLGEVDDIEEVLNELSKEYEIVDVEWPSEDTSDDEDEAEDDGSGSLNKKVYDNKHEKAEQDRTMKPKLESLTMGERLTIGINEGADAGSLESRFTTASQLMVYHALLELGIPELALSRSAFRAEIMKNIKTKAMELTTSPTMKNALKTFINRSIDYEDKAQHNKDAINSVKKPVKESLNEGVTQDFWGAFLELVNYIAASPDDAKQLLSNPAMKQIMTRSSASLSSNVSSQIKTKLIDFKNSLSGDGSTAQLKAAGVAESYLDSSSKLLEGSSPAEVTELFKSLLMLADPSKDGLATETVLNSSAWNSFFNAAKGSLSQKFGGTARAKLNQLKAVLPKTTATAPATGATSPTATSSSATPSGNATAQATESKKTFAAALKMSEEKSLKNATLAHAYSYGSEKFDEGHPIEVIGEEGDSYIVKAFPIMANSHIKMKKTSVKLTGKINVPVGGNNGKMDGGLNEGPEDQLKAIAIQIGKFQELLVKFPNNPGYKTNLERLQKQQAQIASSIGKKINESLLKKGDRVQLNLKNWKGSVDQKSKGVGVVMGKEGQAFIVKLDDLTREVLVYPDDLIEVKILKESQVPDWTYDMDDENVVIQCSTIKVILDEEEVEKLVKGITNKDTVIVRDAEDQTHKVAFSPRGSSIMVKKVGTTEGVMMKQKNVDDLLDFVSKGDDEESKPKKKGDDEEAQPTGSDESSEPKEQEKT